MDDTWPDDVIQPSDIEGGGLLGMAKQAMGVGGTFKGSVWSKLVAPEDGTFEQMKSLDEYLGKLKKKWGDLDEKGNMEILFGGRVKSDKTTAKIFEMYVIRVPLRSSFDDRARLILMRKGKKEFHFMTSLEERDMNPHIEFQLTRANQLTVTKGGTRFDFSLDGVDQPPPEIGELREQLLKSGAENSLTFGIDKTKVQSLEVSQPLKKLIDRSIYRKVSEDGIWERCYITTYSYTQGTLKVQCRLFRDLDTPSEPTKIQFCCLLSAEEYLKYNKTWKDHPDIRSDQGEGQGKDPENCIPVFGKSELNPYLTGGEFNVTYKEGKLGITFNFDGTIKASETPSVKKGVKEGDQMIRVGGQDIFSEHPTVDSAAIDAWLEQKKVQLAKRPLTITFKRPGAGAGAGAGAGETTNAGDNEDAGAGAPAVTTQTYSGMDWDKFMKDYNTRTMYIVAFARKQITQDERTGEATTAGAAWEHPFKEVTASGEYELAKFDSDYPAVILVYDEEAGFIPYVYSSGTNLKQKKEHMDELLIKTETHTEMRWEAKRLEAYGKNGENKDQLYKYRAHIYTPIPKKSETPESGDVSRVVKYVDYTDKLTRIEDLLKKAKDTWKGDDDQTTFQTLFPKKRLSSSAVGGPPYETLTDADKGWYPDARKALEGVYTSTKTAVVGAEANPILLIQRALEEGNINKKLDEIQDFEEKLSGLALRIMTCHCYFVHTDFDDYSVPEATTYTLLRVPYAQKTDEKGYPQYIETEYPRRHVFTDGDNTKYFISRVLWYGAVEYKSYKRHSCLSEGLHKEWFDEHVWKERGTSVLISGNSEKAANGHNIRVPIPLTKDPSAQPTISIERIKDLFAVDKTEQQLSAPIRAFNGTPLGNLADTQTLNGYFSKVQKKIKDGLTGGKKKFTFKTTGESGKKVAGTSLRKAGDFVNKFLPRLMQGEVGFRESLPKEEGEIQDKEQADLLSGLKELLKKHVYDAVIDAKGDLPEKLTNNAENKRMMGTDSILDAELIRLYNDIDTKKDTEGLDDLKTKIVEALKKRYNDLKQAKSSKKKSYADRQGKEANNRVLRELKSYIPSGAFSSNNIKYDDLQKDWKFAHESLEQKEQGLRKVETHFERFKQVLIVRFAKYLSGSSKSWKDDWQNLMNYEPKHNSNQTLQNRCTAFRWVERFYACIGDGPDPDKTKTFEVFAKVIDQVNKLKYSTESAGGDTSKFGTEAQALLWTHGKVRIVVTLPDVGKKELIFQAAPAEEGGEQKGLNTIYNIHRTIKGGGRLTKADILEREAELGYRDMALRRAYNAQARARRARQ